MLNRKLSPLQWASLVILFVGVSIVQLSPQEASKASTVSSNQKPIMGLFAVLASCLMTGFASVYFEKILKGTKQTLWLRNVQLGGIGVIFGLVTMKVNDGPKVRDHGFFYGYDKWVWLVVCLQSFGGLMVAVVVKYADNILKGFATSTAIVISCICSMYFFNFQISPPFIAGTALVLSAVFVFSKFVPKHPEPPPDLKPNTDVV